MLVTSKMDCSTKKPFRVNNAWFRDPSSSDLIKSEWKSTVSGYAAYKLVNCLYSTKHYLRNWNYLHFGNINSHIANQEAHVYLTRNNNTQNVTAVEELTRKLKQWYDIEEDYWRQRGKDDAMLLDDRNTAYFHQKANFRRQKHKLSLYEII